MGMQFELSVFILLNQYTATLNAASPRWYYPVRVQRVRTYNSSSQPNT